ncbi:MAG: spore cortex-lytic enzyme [Caldicoprobacterales bacterium]|jgi:N-acetylmuramoyl-L-alanine amidase|nr:spore cortex-lytic enzyme [Clostridiales bacterium]
MKAKQRLLVISVLLTFLICMSLIVQSYIFKKDAEEVVVYWGMTGGKVYEIQQKLKQWGYYDGPIDGIYGAKTFDAVKKFQAKNGLAVDGTVGKQTAAAMGINLGTASGGGGVSAPSRGGGGARGDGDVYLLARAVHGEARGEPYLGKVAVAAVILNRVADPRFPNTIAGVIYQPGAFTAVSDGQINLTPDEESLRAARDALNGWDPTYGAIYYYNPAKATSSWIWSRPVHLVIGKHHFAT